MKTNLIFLLFILAITNCGSKNSTNKCQHFNESITVINYGNLNRDEIAQLIKKIQSLNPAVIGLKVFFVNEKQGDDDLKELIAADNIVLPVRVMGNELKKSYFKNQSFGASDLILNEKTNRVDEFLIYENYNEDTIKSFSVKILEKYSNTYKPDLKESKYQSIDFNGNCYCFIVADHTIIDNIYKDHIENNIVLLGYLGEEFEISGCIKEDKDVHYTEFNDGEKMYSTIISANVLYTLMKQQGIE